MRSETTNDEGLFALLGVLNDEESEWTLVEHAGELHLVIADEVDDSAEGENL